MKIQVQVGRGEDGYFVARCPVLKSCWSQGKTREEALENIREAMTLYLEPTLGDRPENIDEEVVELSRGDAMADALERLAESGGIAAVEDPVAWQRELREDRPLPRAGA